MSEWFTSHDVPAYPEGQEHCSTLVALPKSVLDVVVVDIDTPLNLTKQIGDSHKILTNYSQKINF